MLTPQYGTEIFILIAVIVLPGAGILCIMRQDWKKYGSLYLLSAVVGWILCYLFVKIGFYDFPVRFFPNLSEVPLLPLLTAVPFYVLLGVRYSPRSWAWKIPFYWGMVHLVVFAEGWAQYETGLLRYLKLWDLWDSYTWWWIYLLVFEWVGGTIIPDEKRRPLDHAALQYGKIGWFLLHVILIVTVFLSGFYLGRMV